MKIKSIFLLCCILAFSGCIQSKEHLTINKDGSGILESTVTVPAATAQMIETMMGGMMQAMQGMAQGMGEGLGAPPKETPPLPSMGDAMLGSREKLLKDAQKAGLTVEILAFQKEKKGGGEERYYKMKFDDINKLMRSGIVGTKITLAKDAQGNLSLALVREPKKEQESKMQRQQLNAFKESDKFQNMPPEAQKQFMEAMANFRIEFSVTMPNEITNVSGPFEKTDANTATMSLGGDIMNDPSLLTQLYEQSSGSAAVMCSAKDTTFHPTLPAEAPSAPAEEPMEFLPVRPADAQPPAQGNTREEFLLSPPTEPMPVENPLLNIPPSTVMPVPLVGLSTGGGAGTSKAKVYLVNGKVIEGVLIQETDGYVKVEMPEVGTITYYRDEIERIER